MTELLAPAGNMEAFYAAILNGADAVYLGGKNFSARAFAENFDDSALSEVIRVAHFHGKKVYITVNTLVDDAELTQALEDISHWYLLGLDGLIIQDVGLLYRLRQIMPDLP
ncbi:MAG: U32 family peptidase, partial [Clostridiales bacterium]